MPPRVRRKLQVTLDEVQQRGHGGPICETTQSAEWDQRRFAAPAHQQFTTLSGGGPALEASWSHPTAFARRRISQPWQRGSLGLGGRTIQNGKPVPNTRRMLEWLMTRENDSASAFRLMRSINTDGGEPQRCEIVEPFGICRLLYKEGNWRTSFGDDRAYCLSFSR